MKIGVLIYTYNRNDDARINMEIIRSVWSKNSTLKDVVIVHSFNGEKEWWPEKYLEDELLYLDNPGHFEGAVLLMDKGVECFREKYPDVDYVIILAADTWLVKPEYLEYMLLTMKKEEKYLGTSVWGSRKLTNIWSRGSALDFNIFDLQWAQRSNFFPLRFKEFKEQYEELFSYNDQTVYPENVFMLRFKEAIKRSMKIPSDNILKQVAASHIYRMTDREPVHIVGTEKHFFKNNRWERTMYIEKMGFISHHDPVEKQRVLKKWDLSLGTYGTTFLHAKNVDYFNNGLVKNELVKSNGQVIGYGD